MKDLDSSRRMIRLLPPPSPLRKLDRRHTGRLRKRYNLLCLRGEVGEGVGEEPNHTTARRNGPIIIHSVVQYSLLLQLLGRVRGETSVFIYRTLVCFSYLVSQLTLHVSLALVSRLMSHIFHPSSLNSFRSSVAH